MDLKKTLTDVVETAEKDIAAEVLPPSSVSSPAENPDAELKRGIFALVSAGIRYLISKIF